jgi:hypothetical protein
LHGGEVGGEAFAGLVLFGGGGGGGGGHGLGWVGGWVEGFGAVCVCVCCVGVRNLCRVIGKRTIAWWCHEVVCGVVAASPALEEGREGKARKAGLVAVLLCVAVWTNVVMVRRHILCMSIFLCLA